MIWRQRLARWMVLLAGAIYPPLSHQWLADLYHDQQELGESGLRLALSCLMSTPGFAFFGMVDRLWGPELFRCQATGAVLDAGLAAGVKVGLMNIGFGPGLAAGFVGASIGGLVTGLVAGLRAGAARGMLAGSAASIIAGSMATISGLDAGLRFGFENVESILASLLVVCLIARFVAHIHLLHQRDDTLV